MTLTEARLEFVCFGSSCSVAVLGAGTERTADDAAALVERRLHAWHERFSRFLPDSELCRLNADPRVTVPVSATMARFAEAAVAAAEATGGLVDPTLVDEVEKAGYTRDLRGTLPLDLALALGPPRSPAAPASDERWRSIQIDRAGRTVTRPWGVKLDSGGIAKGLFADILAEELSGHAAWAIDCGGDVRVGGIEARPRTIRVGDPFGDEPLHELELARGAAATSGVGRRSWLDSNGRPAHHLLDPASGRPAFTGLVQATALAPTALRAETLAKAALLSGPDEAARWLSHGGVLVFEDGSHEVLEAAEHARAA